MHGDTSISLLKAIRNGDKEFARRILLARNFTDIDRQAPRKDGTALFWACCLGYIDLVHLLLLNGSDVNKCTAWGATPLHACVDHNYVDIVTLLVRFGAKVNQQTDCGDTPCHLASYRGFFSCVKRLTEEGADVTIRNNKRLSPVEEAYINGHTDIYKYLVTVQQIAGRGRSNAKSGNPKQFTSQFPMHTPTEVTSPKQHQQSYLPLPSYSVQIESSSVRSETDESFSIQDCAISSTNVFMNTSEENSDDFRDTSEESSDAFRNTSEVKESNIPGTCTIAGVLCLKKRTLCTNDFSSDFSCLSMNDLSASSSDFTSSSSSSTSSSPTSSLSSVHKLSFKNI